MWKVGWGYLSCTSNNLILSILLYQVKPITSKADSLLLYIINICLHFNNLSGHSLHVVEKELLIHN